MTRVCEVSTPEGTNPSQPDPSQPTEPPAGEPVPGVDFDPYRYGAPEHPIAPEYAPPGYTPPPPPVPPAPQGYPPPVPPVSNASNPWAPPPAPPYAGGPPAQPPQPYYPGYQQQPGYGTQPYQPYAGQYPGSGYGQYPQPSSGPGGKAIAALCLGIASIVLFWTSFFDLVPIVLAIIFGLLAINDARRRPRRNEKAMAIAGVVCALVGLLAATIITVWYVRVVNDCGGFSQFENNTTTTATTDCLDNRFGGTNG